MATFMYNCLTYKLAKLAKLNVPANLASTVKRQRDDYVHVYVDWRGKLEGEDEDIADADDVVDVDDALASFDGFSVRWAWLFAQTV